MSSKDNNYICINRCARLQYLVEKYHFNSLATGQILRQEIESQSDLGLQIKDKMKDGSYVSDEIILNIIKKNLVQSKQKDVLFDGFPRTLGKAQVFDELLLQQNQAIDCVVFFSIDDSVLLNRIQGRYNCSHCGRVYHELNNKPQLVGVCDQCKGTEFVKRSDDTIESFEKRLKVYYENTQPLINYYKNKTNFVEIDASESLDQVTENLIKIIQPYLSQDKE